MMKTQHLLWALALPLITTSSLAEVEFTATWQQELAMQRGGTTQKMEAIFQPEWHTAIGDTMDMTLIGRVRADGADNLGYQGQRLTTDSDLNGALLDGAHWDAQIREWYIDTEIGGAFWRLGKQQVVWGQADGLKVLDVINPQSYREFILDDFDDSRIPLWMVNVEIPVNDDDSLQILWIPDLSYHRFALDGSDYQLSSPLLSPQPVEGVTVAAFNHHKPASPLADSDIGLRYSKFADGWDLTFNYLYHYLDTLVITQQLVADQLTLDSRYRRSHLLGFSASKAFDDWTLRSEVGYSSDTYHLLDSASPAFVSHQGIAHSDDLSSVIGLDWQGFENTMISLQWFQSHIGDHHAGMLRPQTNQIWSLMYKQHFANETWELEVLALYGEDQQDSAVQIELSHMFESNLKLWLAMDLFAGNSSSLFGQFDDTDRLLLGFEWGF